MNILHNFSVPTGNILIGNGTIGLLEFLSLGDYGKDHNLKADSLGLSRNLDKVKHTKLLPLTEKWVITVSSQYGCSIGCNFCDVPKVGIGKNATTQDLIDQVECAMSLHPEITSTKRLNIHFARMGEPTFNRNVIECAHTLYHRYSKVHNIHPVVSTMMPNYNNDLFQYLSIWMNDIKNGLYAGEAGLQISINSTNNKERDIIFNRHALSIEKIAELINKLPNPEGRKITLNFVVANYDIDYNLVSRLFDATKCIIKLTPMHKTTAALVSNSNTPGDYTTYEPYRDVEQSFKQAGFDVLVFIASKEEDDSRITCGNAILSYLKLV